MPRKAYIGGTDRLAHKITKMYLGGADNLAKKVKKAYIGIGGFARPFFSGGELTYYGTTTQPITYGIDTGAATTVGDCAIFAGGKNSLNVGSGSSFRSTNDVYVYHKSLVLLSQPKLKSARHLLSAATIGDYALFAGGYSDSANSSSKLRPEVDGFTSSLTHITNVPNLAQATDDMAATTVGDYALFAGGRYTIINAYNSSLTRTNIYLNKSAAGMAATTVGDYALFAGGYNVSDPSNLYSTVEAYDSSLTRIEIQPESFATGRSRQGGATVGNYAIFAGGLGTYGQISVVISYNTSLTKGSAKNIVQPRGWIASTTLGDYALFGGGYTPPSDIHYETRYAGVDVYSDSLTHTTINSLSRRSSGGCATTVDNYALFAGGIADPDDYNTKVDVYTII